MLYVILPWDKYMYFVVENYVGNFPELLATIYFPSIRGQIMPTFRT
jgi:hypothetical protein